MERLLTGILFFFNALLYSQQSIPQFNFYNQKIKLYVVGEDHYRNNSEVQLGIINYLQENTTMNTLILEVPIEVGKIMNEYVLTGNKENEVKEILDLFNPVAENNVFCLLKHIRTFNMQKDDEEKNQIRGIDMMSFDTYQTQIKALYYLFPEFKGSNIPIIDKYLINSKGSNVSKKDRVKVFDSLLEDVGKNHDLYFTYLKDRLEIYKSQIIEIKYNYTDGWKRQDSIRESILTRNLISEIDTNKVQLLICGASHALTLKNDSWYFGYPFTTMVANAKSVLHNGLFSIVTEYYEKKPIRFFSEFNLLSIPPKSYFTNRTPKYVVIENLEAHPEASKRCDMIIIQNTRWKPVVK
jgi:hypothetical protein